VITSPDATTEIRCSNCQRPYPPEGTPYRCPTCSGFFDFPILPPFDPARIDPSQPGLWCFRPSLGLADSAPLVTIGEGNTPLVLRGVFGREVAFKLEFLNPTGSYKDRGSAVLISFLRSRGVDQAVEDSSGNAGASFAAYAAASGMLGRVFIPDYASGPKRAQIETYGAQVVRVLGSRVKTTETALAAVERGAVYASHAYMPHGLAGYATLAFELFQQLGQAPGSVILPVGQGGLLLGVGRGFQALQRAGLIARIPQLIGVQALACAPLWALSRYGPSGLGWVAEGETLAEGIRVRHPLRGDRVLELVQQSGGEMLAVDETEILPGRQALANLGFYVEPTSAVIWKALEQLGERLVDPVVVILTGSGLKSIA